MGSLVEVGLNTLKILRTKCGAFVQQINKSIDF